MGIQEGLNCEPLIYTLSVSQIRPAVQTWLEVQVCQLRSATLVELGYSNLGTPSWPTLWPSGLGNYFACKRFTVQTLLWSLEFMILQNLKCDTIAVSNFDRS